jgi:hypothetical protein
MALEFLVGNSDEGDTVNSCSGGLLGKQVSLTTITNTMTIFSLF